MTKQQMYHFIKKALDNIALNGPSNPYLGICESVTSRLLKTDDNLKDEICEMLEGLFMDWPDKSCSDTYPVGNWTQRPDRLFWDHFDNTKSMWERGTQYGDARWSLLEFARKQLKEF